MEKFRLPRQKMSDEFRGIISREMKKHGDVLTVASTKRMTEIARVVKEIEVCGLPKRFVKKKLSKELGYGIFLHPDAKPILRGEVIAPYSGNVSFERKSRVDDAAYAFDLVDIVYLTKEEQEIFDKNGPYSARRQYVAKLDALKQGNFTRFVNHSDNPNVMAVSLRIPKNRLGLREMPSEVIYIAKKRINPCEQLLSCYEDEEKGYWGVFKIVPFPMTPKTFQIDSRLRLVRS